MAQHFHLQADVSCLLAFVGGGLVPQWLSVIPFNFIRKLKRSSASAFLSHSSQSYELVKSSFLQSEIHRVHLLMSAVNISVLRLVWTYAILSN